MIARDSIPGRSTKELEGDEDHTDRSLHVSYSTDDHEQRYAIRDSIITLINKAISRNDTDYGAFTVLDAGCGIGLLLRDLKELGIENVTGVDMDPTCVANASDFAECDQGTVEDIEDLYGRNSFDLIVLSHVLEHLEDPLMVLEAVKRVTRKWVVVAVPNPLRPRIQLKYTWHSSNYSNKGHVFSWDRSHLENFLVRKSGLEIVAWAVDRVRVVPYDPIRSIAKSVGLLDLLERRILADRLPYYSDSLIALCKQPHG